MSLELRTITLNDTIGHLLSLSNPSDITQPDGFNVEIKGAVFQLSGYQHTELNVGDEYEYTSMQSLEPAYGSPLIPCSFNRLSNNKFSASFVYTSPNSNELYDCYLIYEDENGVNRVFSVSRFYLNGTATPYQYLADSQLPVEIQITLANASLLGKIRFIYSQAQEIGAHNDDPNAHETYLNRYGIKNTQNELTYTGQSIDAFADLRVSNTVSNFDAVAFVNGEYVLATPSTGVIGIYQQDVGNVVSLGLINIAGFNAGDFIYLDVNNPGKLSTTSSDFYIGKIVSENTLKVAIGENLSVETRVESFNFNLLQDGVTYNTIHIGDNCNQPTDAEDVYKVKTSTSNPALNIRTQIAESSRDASLIFVRNFDGTLWSSWNFPYASWYNGPADLESGTGIVNQNPHVIVNFVGQYASRALLSMVSPYRGDWAKVENDETQQGSPTRYYASFDPAQQKFIWAYGGVALDSFISLDSMLKLGDRKLFRVGSTSGVESVVWRRAGETLSKTQYLDFYNLLYQDWEFAQEDPRTSINPADSTSFTWYKGRKYNFVDFATHESLGVDFNGDYWTINNTNFIIPKFPHRELIKELKGETDNANVHWKMKVYSNRDVELTYESSGLTANTAELPFTFPIEFEQKPNEIGMFHNTTVNATAAVTTLRASPYNLTTTSMQAQFIPAGNYFTLAGKATVTSLENLGIEEYDYYVLLGNQEPVVASIPVIADPNPYLPLGQVQILNRPVKAEEEGFRVGENTILDTMYHQELIDYLGECYARAKDNFLDENIGLVQDPIDKAKFIPMSNYTQVYGAWGYSGSSDLTFKSPTISPVELYSLEECQTEGSEDGNLWQSSGGAIALNTPFFTATEDFHGMLYIVNTGNGDTVINIFSADGEEIASPIARVWAAGSYNSTPISMRRGQYLARVGGEQVGIYGFLKKYSLPNYKYPTFLCSTKQPELEVRPVVFPSQSSLMAAPIGVMVDIQRNIDIAEKALYHKTGDALTWGLHPDTVDENNLPVKGIDNKLLESYIRAYGAGDTFHNKFPIDLTLGTYHDEVEDWWFCTQDAYNDYIARYNFCPCFTVINPQPNASAPTSFDAIRVPHAIDEENYNRAIPFQIVPQPATATTTVIADGWAKIVTAPNNNNEVWCYLNGIEIAYTYIGNARNTQMIKVRKGDVISFAGNGLFSSIEIYPFLPKKDVYFTLMNAINRQSADLLNVNSQELLSSIQGAYKSFNNLSPSDVANLRKNMFDLDLASSKNLTWPTVVNVATIVKFPDGSDRAPSDGRWIIASSLSTQIWAKTCSDLSMADSTIKDFYGWGADLLGATTIEVKKGDYLVVKTNNLTSPTLNKFIPYKTQGNSQQGFGFRGMGSVDTLDNAPAPLMSNSFIVALDTNKIHYAKDNGDNTFSWDENGVLSSAFIQKEWDLPGPNNTRNYVVGGVLVPEDCEGFNFGSNQNLGSTQNACRVFDEKGNFLFNASCGNNHGLDGGLLNYPLKKGWKIQLFSDGGLVPNNTTWFYESTANLGGEYDATAIIWFYTTKGSIKDSSLNLLPEVSTQTEYDALSVGEAYWNTIDVDSFGGKTLCKKSP